MDAEHSDHLSGRLLDCLEDSLEEKRFPENLPTGWRKHLTVEKEKDYFKSLSRFLMQEYRAKKSIYPPQGQVLRALQSVDYENVKIVILGQDPYHGPQQAIGLSFAVPNSLRKKPPSLQNIFKELESDLKIRVNFQASDLTGWAAQGVLLLNSVLTVRASQAFSHRGKGWEEFTDQIIRKLNQREKPLIFILWGSAAQNKKSMIDQKKHYILESVHPSPLSAYRGFFGSRPFSASNEILQKLGETPINWASMTLENGRKK